MQGTFVLCCSVVPFSIAWRTFSTVAWGPRRWQIHAVCCRVLQSVAVKHLTTHCNTLQHTDTATHNLQQCLAVCCAVAWLCCCGALQCSAMYCSLLHCITVCCSRMLQQSIAQSWSAYRERLFWIHISPCSALQWHASVVVVCGSILHCVAAVRCAVMECVSRATFFISR